MKIMHLRKYILFFILFSIYLNQKIGSKRKLHRNCFYYDILCRALLFIKIYVFEYILFVLKQKFLKIVLSKNLI